MGVYFKQHAILGFEIKHKDSKVIISDAVYEEQARYDTKTGKQTHTEKVLVKEAEYKYVYRDLEEECFYYLANKLEDKYKEYSFISVIDIDDSILVGFNLNEKQLDYGRACLLETEIDFDDLLDRTYALMNIFPDEKISLIFRSTAG